MSRGRGRGKSPPPPWLSLSARRSVTYVDDDVTPPPLLLLFFLGGGPQLFFQVGKNVSERPFFQGWRRRLREAASRHFATPKQTLCRPCFMTFDNNSHCRLLNIDIIVKWLKCWILMSQWYMIMFTMIFFFLKWINGWILSMQPRMNNDEQWWQTTKVHYCIQALVFSHQGKIITTGKTGH